MLIKKKKIVGSHQASCWKLTFAIQDHGFLNKTAVLILLLSSEGICVDDQYARMCFVVKLTLGDMYYILSNISGFSLYSFCHSSTYKKTLLNLWNRSNVDVPILFSPLRSEILSC